MSASVVSLLRKDGDLHMFLSALCKFYIFLWLSVEDTIRNCYHLYKHLLTCLLEHRAFVFVFVLAHFIVIDKKRKRRYS